jgi:hypothetical protein
MSDLLTCFLCSYTISMYSDEAAEWLWPTDDECVCLLCAEEAERDLILERFGIGGLERITANMAAMWVTLDREGLDLS